MTTDTIAAIATGMNQSGISIIRVSGKQAISIVSSIFYTKGNRQILKDVETHTIHYGFIKSNDAFIDEVMVSVMKAPKSYTREDVVEINCHGGIFVTKKVLQAVLDAGARLSKPGEFTQRAFLNGRIDLSQAEAVMDLIEAKSEFAHKSSAYQLQGKIKKEIISLRERILYEIAFIESAIDDPEHISLDGYKERLNEITIEIKDRIEYLLKNAENGQILKDGIRTAIVGKPNAGKSSFLNALLGKDRAIVTDIAGTTRDTLEESVLVNGVLLHLIDTAGIHDSSDLVEKIGIEKSKEAATQADLILFIADSSIPFEEVDDDILSFLEDKKMIVLLNKSDLAEKVSKMQIREKIGMDVPIIKISSKENTGIDEFENLIYEMFLNGKIEMEHEVYITNVRHKEALKEAEDAISMVIKSLLNDMPEDFYSIDLMNAYSSLGKIIGEEVGDDLAQEIFSKFCMGK